MNECENYREMISAMLDGELDAGESERLVAHLSLCAECRQLYELLSSVSGDGVWELPEVPEGLHGRIMSGVRAEAAERKKRARIIRLRPFAAAAACLVLIVGVVLGLPRMRMGGNAPRAMFNTMASASGSAGPAADAPAYAPADVPADIPADMEAPAEAADTAGDAENDGRAEDSLSGSEYGEGYDYVVSATEPEAAPVPEPDAPADVPADVSADVSAASKDETPAEPELDIDRGVLTVESGGESVSSRLSRGDTLLWLRSVIEQRSGSFDTARLEVFRRGGADYEVYFYRDGGKLMGSLSKELTDSVELTGLADFARFAEMADEDK